MKLSIHGFSSLDLICAPVNFWLQLYTCPGTPPAVALYYNIAPLICKGNTLHSALSIQHSEISPQHSAISNQQLALRTQQSALSTQHSEPITPSIVISEFDNLTMYTIFPDLVCAVHLETSHKLVALVFRIPLVARIHGNL